LLSQAKLRPGLLSNNLHRLFRPQIPAIETNKAGP
jgi:hypothetical protein